jgi:hypothetical protein
LIRISITSAAFEPIARTLPLGSVAVEPETNEHGEHRTRVEAATVIGSGQCGASGES